MMPLRLGLLGMWHTHAHGLVRQIAEHPDEFQLAGMFDPDRHVAADRRAKWAKLIGDVPVFPRAEDVLGLPLDAVAVEGRVHENLSWARMALASGRPVLLEKPAGTNLDEFHGVIDLAQRKHLHVQMIYLFRYMSGVLEMLRRARSGSLGRLYYFRGRLPKDLPSYSRYVEELGRYGGGIFFEMAGHLVDMMVAMFGKPKAVTPFLAHHHTEPGAFVDNGVAVFEFDRAFGVIEVPALEVVDFARRIEVYGTQGACVIPHLGSGHLANKAIQPIEIAKAGESGWQRLDLPAATLQISDLREFAAVVAAKKEPDVTKDHDLVVQETLLRASGML
jgi:predicted dehydrogenase